MNATALVSDAAGATSFYNYVPTHEVCIAFLVLFGISTGLHVIQAFCYKTWWLFPSAVIAGVGEIIGWFGREWSSRDVLSQWAFSMQSVSTILAPTPLLAANFIIFGKMIGTFGERYSRLRPKLYFWVFLICDIVSLAVQATGSAIVASATTQAGLDQGNHVTLGGVVFQLASLLVFICLALEYFVRFQFDLPQYEVAPPVHAYEPHLAISFAALSRSGTFDSVTSATKLVHNYRAPRPWTLKLRLAVFGLSLSSVLIFIRSIYRTVELTDGWNGRINSTEMYFDILDGAMIVAALFTLIIFHPGRLLAPVEPAPIPTWHDDVHDKDTTFIPF